MHYKIASQRSAHLQGFSHSQDALLAMRHIRKHVFTGLTANAVNTIKEVPQNK